MTYLFRGSSSKIATLPLCEIKMQLHKLLMDAVLTCLPCLLPLSENERRCELMATGKHRNKWSAPVLNELQDLQPELHLQSKQESKAVHCR
jgi:hypothetical protein